MLLLQERMRALERLEPADLPRRGQVHRHPLPAEDPVAHFLPPSRLHERMNVERGRHRLHLHPALPAEAHRGQLELRTVLLDLLRTGARHRHLPLLGGSVYKSEGGFAVSFKRSLDGTAWKNPVDRADDEPDHRELKEVIHSLERDPRTKRSNLVLASLRQDGVAAHENPEKQTEGRALCEWISPTVEEGVEVRDD